MHYKHRLFIVFALLTFGAIGCEQSDPVRPEVSPAERRQILDDVARAELEAKNTTAPDPNIELATPQGWTRSEPRSLPPDDHGFTVAYEHESGLAVTLYQYTRGLKLIQNDVNSSIVKEEMDHAKNGIEQAVRLGYWKDAKETNSKTIRLGDSQQQALWTQYQLTVDGMIVASDIYVWARANTLFKVRCTARSEDATSNQTILRPLLTAFSSSDVDEKTK